jgi:hypothetical protein
VIETPVAARHPRRVALLTATGLNLVPLALLIALVAVLATSKGDFSSDEGRLDPHLVMILASYCAGLWLVATGMAVGLAIAEVRRQLRSARPTPVTARTAVAVGVLGFVVGWTVAVALIPLLIWLNRVF